MAKPASPEPRHEQPLAERGEIEQQKIEPAKEVRNELKEVQQEIAITTVRRERAQKRLGEFQAQRAQSQEDSTKTEDAETIGNYRKDIEEFNRQIEMWQGQVRLLETQLAGLGARQQELAQEQREKEVVSVRGAQDEADAARELVERLVRTGGTDKEMQTAISRLKQAKKVMLERDSQLQISVVTNADMVTVAAYFRGLDLLPLPEKNETNPGGGEMTIRYIYRLTQLHAQGQIVSDQTYEALQKLSKDSPNKQLRLMAVIALYKTGGKDHLDEPVRIAMESDNIFAVLDAMGLRNKKLGREQWTEEEEKVLLEAYGLRITIDGKTRKRRIDISEDATQLANDVGGKKEEKKEDAPKKVEKEKEKGSGAGEAAGLAVLLAFLATSRNEGETETIAGREFAQINGEPCVVAKDGTPIPIKEHTIEGVNGAIARLVRHNIETELPGDARSNPFRSADTALMKELFGIDLAGDHVISRSEERRMEECMRHLLQGSTGRDLHPLIELGILNDAGEVRLERAKDMRLLFANHFVDLVDWKFEDMRQLVVYWEAHNTHEFVSRDDLRASQQAIR